MLAIRMQRTGRKGHAMFRVVVQDSRQTPTSGKVVARLGSYDPHAKTVVLDKDKAAFYLEHGAQPSDRAARLLKSEGVKMPKWVKEPPKKEGAVRNPDKRRSTAPEKPAEEAPAAEEPAAEAASEPAPEADAGTPASDEQTPAAEAPAAEEAPSADAPAEEKPAEEAPAEQTAAEAPAEEQPSDEKPAES